jgi:hypothetical protein
MHIGGSGSKGSGSGSKGSGSGSKGSGSGSGGKSLGNPSKVGLGGSRLPNNKKSATSYGAGGGSAAAIPLGMPFAGRTAGGGNRQGVYGNRHAMLPLCGSRSGTDCGFTVYMGAVTLVSSFHVASRDLASHISSGR